jgi:hypothetical protein
MFATSETMPAFLQHKLARLSLDANSHLHIFSHKMVFIFIGYIHHKL